MIRFAAIFAVAASLAGCSSSPFSAFSSAPAGRVAPASAAAPYAQPGIQQSQYECVTDEGYGRFTPCGNKD